MKLAEAQDPEEESPGSGVNAASVDLWTIPCGETPNWFRLTERNIAAPHVLVFQARRSAMVPRSADL